VKILATPVPVETEITLVPGLLQLKGIIVLATVNLDSGYGFIVKTVVSATNRMTAIDKCFHPQVSDCFGVQFPPMCQTQNFTNSNMNPVLGIFSLAPME
jgi:hypothetical protein